MNKLLTKESKPERTYLEAGVIPDGKRAMALLAMVAFGLWLDRFSPLWGQVAAGFLFWGLFISIYHRMPAESRGLLMSCLIIATLGEIFCSLVWQLYDYRLYNIPHYVPPGHVLVFLLGSALASRISPKVVWIVPLLTAPYVIAGYVMGFDEFGIILFLMFMACMIAEDDKRLYATMFLVCLALEIYGTLLGNWVWKPAVPLWGLSNTNPPVASGAFYCVLDFLMLRAMLASRPVAVFFADIINKAGKRIREIFRPEETFPANYELAAEEYEDR
ncbi:MAG: hypothetical protein OEV42_07615 [Deltaproteobacteria bacterium]|nr:hypothetical protein [Deltaproteobacteria bacterium]